MKLSRQKGFAFVELILILVIVGIIAFVAWRIIDAQATVDQALNQTNGSTVAPESKPVENSDDLNKLDAQLEAETVEDDTTTELEDETSF